MSKYTIRRSDAEEKDRTWQGGHYAVRNKKGAVVLFMFDYPECRSPVCANNEAEALAAAKSFMAIDDLVESVRGLSTVIEIAANGNDGAKYFSIETRSGSFVRVADALEQAKTALEKAGIK